MTWVILGILLVLLVAAVPVRRSLAARRERELVAREAFRTNRRLVDEDVTVLGEQLALLHEETLAETLDSAARDDYRQALVTYETAKERLAAATTVEDCAAVTTALEDGRFLKATVLARVAGTELPRRREECYFNPQHGPAMADVDWTPPGSVARRIAVCASDARRLAGGEPPDLRLVRVGDRYVPWYAAPHERGLLHASIAAAAISGVPPYVMLLADLGRTANQLDGGGFGGI